MASAKELAVRDQMRVPLRKIIEVVRFHLGNNNLEDDGLAELKLHSAIGEYIVECAKQAEIVWLPINGRPLISEQAAALVDLISKR